MKFARLTLFSLFLLMAMAFFPPAGIAQDAPAGDAASQDELRQLLDLVQGTEALSVDLRALQEEMDKYEMVLKSLERTREALTGSVPEIISRDVATEINDYVDMILAPDASDDSVINNYSEMVSIVDQVYYDVTSNPFITELGELQYNLSDEYGMIDNPVFQDVYAAIDEMYMQNVLPQAFDELYRVTIYTSYPYEIRNIVRDNMHLFRDIKSADLKGAYETYAEFVGSMVDDILTMVEPAKAEAEAELNKLRAQKDEIIMALLESYVQKNTPAKVESNNTPMLIMLAGMALMALCFIILAVFAKNSLATIAKIEKR